MINNRIATYENNIEEKINEYRIKMRDLSLDQTVLEVQLRNIRFDKNTSNATKKLIDDVVEYERKNTEIKVIYRLKNVYLTFIEDLLSLEDKDIDNE